MATGTIKNVTDIKYVEDTWTGSTTAGTTVTKANPVGSKHYMGVAISKAYGSANYDYPGIQLTDSDVRIKPTVTQSNVTIKYIIFYRD